MQHASHRNFEKLLKNGVRLFEFPGTLLHQKVMTIDGVWSAIGSSNFDDRSFETNDEITLMTKPRKGQYGGMLSRDEFRLRFYGSFAHPDFEAIGEAVGQVEAVAWDIYINSKKTAQTVKAGHEFADPDYDLSLDWKQARDRLIAAEARQKDPGTPSRVLLVCGADRNDGTCPGEMSKTFRLMQIAREVLEASALEVDRASCRGCNAGIPCRAAEGPGRSIDHCQHAGAGHRRRHQRQRMDPRISLTDRLRRSGLYIDQAVPFSIGGLASLSTCLCQISSPLRQTSRTR